MPASQTLPRVQAALGFPHLRGNGDWNAFDREEQRRFARKMAMNILRLIGQRGLLGPDAPVRHEAKRRRIKTVMQELIYRAGPLIEHGRQMVLGLGANDRAASVFMRLHAQFAATA